MPCCVVLELLLPACPMAKVRRVSRNRIKWKQICRHLLCPLSGVAKQQDEPHILLLACVASIALFGTCLNLSPFHRHPFWLGHKLYADSWPCELLEILMSRINYSRQKLLANRINLSQFKGERGRDKRGEREMARVGRHFVWHSRHINCSTGSKRFDWETWQEPTHNFARFQFL